MFAHARLQCFLPLGATAQCCCLAQVPCSRPHQINSLPHSALSAPAAAPPPPLLPMQLRAHVHRRLHASVEEDASNEANLGELAQRHEKAAGEQAALEQRLKLARIERAKQLAAAQVGVRQRS